MADSPAIVIATVAGERAVGPAREGGPTRKVKDMFTIDDIREIAIQIERNGEQTYRQAAAHVKRPEIGELFMRLADEEQRHAEWFESIRSGKTLTSEQLELEKMGRQLLQEMVADQTFSLDRQELQRSRSIADVLEQSRVFEQDTILFYEFLQSVIDDDEVREQLAAIIAEERRHVDQLGALAESLTAGGQKHST